MLLALLAASNITPVPPVPPPPLVYSFPIALGPMRSSCRFCNRHYAILTGGHCRSGTGGFHSSPIHFASTRAPVIASASAQDGINDLKAELTESSGKGEDEYSQCRDYGQRQFLLERSWLKLQLQGNRHGDKLSKLC